MDEVHMKEVYNGCHELENTFRARSYDELKTMLDEHYHCNDATVEATATPPPNDYGRKEETTDPDLEDDVPMEFDKKPTAVEDDPLDDDKVKELLAGLDDV